MKILVADDDTSARRALRDLLQALNHRVVTAADGEQAVHSFDAERPDLVLLDVEMPMIDGFQVARHIRAEATPEWIPIIFLSGRGEPDMVTEGLQAGGDDYLTKPVNLEVLLAKIDALLRLTTTQPASEQNPVPESSIPVAPKMEIRWFFPEPAISKRPVLFAGSTPSLLTDWYNVSSDPGCGIKLQTGRLEMKLLLESSREWQSPDAAGKLEKWCKWSLPLPIAPSVSCLQATGWLAVEKSRSLNYFTVTGGEVKPLEQRPAGGCKFEWTELTVAQQTWLTLSLEAFGLIDNPLDQLDAVAAYILPQLQDYSLAMTYSCSYGYPEWLSGIAKARDNRRS